MDDETFTYIEYGVAIGLVVAAGLVGRAIESAHFRRLRRSEAALSTIVLSNLNRLPYNWRAASPVLVAGAAVIATDYFKVFAAGIRSLVGGRVRSYETLLERARRQAIVRMTDEARRLGANVVWNVRFETSTISTGRRGGGVSVLAYGTAMRVI